MACFSNLHSLPQLSLVVSFTGKLSDSNCFYFQQLPPVNDVSNSFIYVTLTPNKAVIFVIISGQGELSTQHLCRDLHLRFYWQLKLAQVINEMCFLNYFAVVIYVCALLKASVLPLSNFSSAKCINRKIKYYAKSEVKVKSVFNITHNVIKIVKEKLLYFNFCTSQATDVSIDKPERSTKRKPFTFTSIPANNYLEFITKVYPERKGATSELLKLKKTD